jgi:hypothetical protein
MAPGAGWLTALGLNPTWEALGAQLAVVAVALLGLYFAAGAQRRRAGSA